MVFLPANSPTLLLWAESKANIPLAIKSSLTAGGHLSLPAHQWNLPSVTPTVTHPSAKIPHSHLVPQAFPLWRIPIIVPKLSSCVPASTRQCSYQCSAPVCSRKARQVCRCWAVWAHAFVQLMYRTCICYSECSERSVRSARWYLPALESYTEVSKLPDTADLKPTSQVKGTAAS